MMTEEELTRVVGQIRRGYEQEIEMLHNLVDSLTDSRDRWKGLAVYWKEAAQKLMEEKDV